MLVIIYTQPARKRIYMKNRKLIIEEIIVITKFGEFYQNRTSARHKPAEERMLEHVYNLVQNAKEAHEKKTDTDEAEHLTRMTLSEFSLYTSAKPLTLYEYKKFIAGVNEIAKKLPANIHLVLATVSVLWTDNKIHNSALYVQSPNQSGDKPIIYHFEKKLPSQEDLRYSYNYIFKYPLYDTRDADCYNTSDSPNIKLADTAVCLASPNQYRGAFRTISRHGTAFTTVVEICVEHKADTGTDDLKKLFMQLSAASIPIPEHSTHVISSCTVPINREKLCAEVIHADYCFTQYNSLYFLYSHAVKNYEYKHPIFGTSLNVIFFHPRAMGYVKYANLNFDSQNFLSAEDILSTIKKSILAEEDLSETKVDIQKDEQKMILAANPTVKTLFRLSFEASIQALAQTPGQNPEVNAAP